MTRRVPKGRVTRQRRTRRERGKGWWEEEGDERGKGERIGEGGVTRESSVDARTTGPPGQPGPKTREIRRSECVVEASDRGGRDDQAWGL